MSTVQAASEVGCQTQTITKHIRAGNLVASKNNGRDWQIAREDFEHWKAHRRKAGRPRRFDK